MAAERVILIPGMGADERLFEPQRAAGLGFEVPPFPMPGRRDDLAAYAARYRDSIQLDGPCVLGGVSFGGMVACEMARLCNPRCVLLIASCCSCAGIPRYARPAEWIARLLPDALIRRRCEGSSRALTRLESLTEEQYQLIRDMSLKVPVPFLRRVGRMIVQWKPAPPPPCPVYHIHGTRDQVIRFKKVSPTDVVPGGGHLINMTHSEQVNAFLQRHMGASPDNSELQPAHDCESSPPGCFSSPGLEDGA